MSDCLTIGDRAPFLDSQTQRKNLARNEREVRVLNIAEQKLGAGVKKGCAHDRKGVLQRYNVTMLQRKSRVPRDGAAPFKRCNSCNPFNARPQAAQAAVLSCFLRISGSFLPSTTARLIVTSAISSRLGTSYMMSSMIRSSIERSARAPVPFVTDCAARARNASFVTVRRTPSIENSLVYCFTMAFFVSV